MFAGKGVKSSIIGALKSIQNRTCIKFIPMSKLAILNASVSPKFGVIFSSHGDRYVLCSVRCLLESFQLSCDHH